jgi:hypothetical protein
MASGDGDSTLSPDLMILFRTLEIKGYRTLFGGPKLQKLQGFLSLALSFSLCIFWGFTGL